MYKVVALYGKGGVGKDFILNSLCKFYGDKVNRIVSTTTRPRRPKEHDGVDYHYITDKQFQEAINNDEFFEYVKFRDWYYGTKFDALSTDKLNIGVFNLDGIKILESMEEVELLPILIDAHDSTRLARMMLRSIEDFDGKEICRRYLADEEDFKDFEKDRKSCLVYDNDKSKAFNVKFFFRRVKIKEFD